MKTAVSLAAFGAAAALSPKRGYVADGCKGSACPDPTLLANAGWYYAYNPADPYGGAEKNQAARFTPMSWCIASNYTVPDYVNTTFFMGFNEPNNVHNCNKDAKTIAAAWKDVMDAFPQSQLVSPATAGDGVAWFDEFFAECNTLYGASGCRISYVAVHDYSCDPPTTMKYIEEIYSKYGHPVWLTEFSCGDGAQGKPTADHLKFMKAIVPLLDASPHVFRYAWMSAHSDNRGLVDASGALTQVGQLYMSL